MKEASDASFFGLQCRDDHVENAKWRPHKDK